MNKQELIEYTQEERRTHQKKNEFQCGYHTAMKHMYDRLVLLDEQEKPVLSKDEAEWVNKLTKSNNLSDSLYYITRCGFRYPFVFVDNGKIYKLSINTKDIKNYEDICKIKERLINAVIFEYEVKKEKRYTVEIPNPNASERGVTYLARKEDGKVELYTWTGYTSIEFEDNWKQQEYAQLTEDEIKEDYAWAWEANLAKEVEE